MFLENLVFFAGDFYRLNVCVLLPPIHGLKIWPQWDYTGDGTSKKVMKVKWNHKGLCSDRICVIIRDIRTLSHTDTHSPHASTEERPYEDLARWPEREFSPETDWPDIDLGLLAFRTPRKRVSALSRSVYHI